MGNITWNLTDIKRRNTSLMWKAALQKRQLVCLLTLDPVACDDHLCDKKTYHTWMVTEAKTMPLAVWSDHGSGAGDSLFKADPSSHWIQSSAIGRHLRTAVLSTGCLASVKGSGAWRPGNPSPIRVHCTHFWALGPWLTVRMGETCSILQIYTQTNYKSG